MGRLLVTGAGGFIGSAVARRFLDEGHEVTTIDNLSTGSAGAIPEGCTSVIADLSSPHTFDHLGEHQFDAIYHIAGQSGGVPSFADPVYDLQANVQSTLLLLTTQHPTRLIIFLFSSSYPLP